MKHRIKDVNALKMSGSNFDRIMRQAFREPTSTQKKSPPKEKKAK